MRHHHKIILISSGALILLVLGLFIYSGYSFKRNSESYKTLSNSMESVSSFSNAMTLNDTINYSTLIRYSDASSKYLHDLKLLNSKIEASLLFKVFQGSSREALLKKMAVLSAYHNSLSESCLQVINDMQPLQKEMHKCNRNYQNHCNKLAGLLTVNNDISDFENYRQEIPALVKEHQKFEKEVQKHIKNHKTSDQTDTLVQLMLNGYASKLQYQLKAFSNNAEKLSDAAKRLSSYKSDMNSMISENYGFFTMIQQIASQYGSIVTKVNYRIEPLHQAFDMLEEPIISNKALGLFTGGKSNYSALDLIQEIDPMTGKTIKTTKVVCDGIEDLSKEIEQIMDITNPYLASVKSFRRSNTRNDQLKLVESSPKLSNYMLSKRKLFAPISLELDKARDDIRQIENVAHQLRVPQAKKYVNQFTTAADDIVDYAYVPFNRWESYVRKITSSLDKMVAMEKKYTSYLSSINDKYMDHKNGKKITNDTRPESNTKKEDIDVHETADNSPSETSSTKDTDKKSIVVEYTTKLSKTDHYNSKGKFLNDAPAIIQQDRANYHKFHKRDPEDEGDSYFTTLEKRFEITRYLHSVGMSKHDSQRIINGSPKIRVMLFSDNSIEIKILD